MEDLKPEIGKVNWKYLYEKALDDLLSRPEEVTLEKVADIILEKGLLDHYAPLDESVKQERIAQSRSVWEGSRSDLGLYEQLWYAVEGSKWSRTVSRDLYWTGVANTAFYKICSNNNTRLKLFPNIEKASDEFLDALQKKILYEYRKRGGLIDLVPIPKGTKGIYHGIPIVVDQYTPDGRIYINGEDEPAHIALYKHTKGKGVAPSEFYSSNFVKTE